MVPDFTAGNIYIYRMSHLKLFMILLGCKPPGRHTEQHDFLFAVGNSLNELVPQIEAFWPEAGVIHIDAWREVTNVEGYEVRIKPKQNGDATATQPKLFFINLGGYQPNRFEEQHYVVLTVKGDKASASRTAKETLFYQHNHFGKAVSHIDDRYGLDVDDLYEIEDILSPSQKELYSIALVPTAGLKEDELHLGYLKLSSLV